MAAEIDHIALAKRNQAALGCLLDDPAAYAEWIATIAFYKAVQMVEASFAHTQTGPTSSHGARLDTLKRTKRYQHVFPHFRELWAASTIARYLTDHYSGRHFRTFTDYITPEKVVTVIVRHRLQQIERSLTGPGFLSERARELLESGAPRSD